MRSAMLAAARGVVLTVTGLLWPVMMASPAIAAVFPGTEDNCLPWHDELASLDDLVIGAITVQPEDLFDVGQAKQALAVHRMATALHVATRESTLRNAMTFAAGDAFSLRALAETERVLRAKRYLREASVVPVRLCGRAVDIQVRSVDNWTLTPAISLGSAGGVNRFTIELQDLNLFGLGKELVFRLKNSDAERSALFGYVDDNVLGSRHHLALELGSNDLDDVYGVAGGLPFHSAAVPLSWWVSARRESDAFALSADDTSDSDGRDDASALVDALHIEAEVARQQVLADGGSLRHRLGLRHERQTTALPSENLDPSTIDTHDVDELYPFIGWSWQRSRWTERKNYLGLGRTEDIDLGASLDVETGLLLEAFGSDRDALRIELAVTRGWQLSQSALHLVELGITQYAGGKNERHVETLRYQHFRWLSEANQLDLQLVAERHVGQSPAKALRLGGEHGLKGYPNAYARGGGRVIGLAELRHVTAWTPFELTHAAFTTFAEVGRIGMPDATGTGGARSRETLADIGAGLVLAPTRSSRGAVLRFDIAVPLVDGDDIDDFQLFVGTQIHY